VHVVNARVGEPGGEQALGEAGAARGGDGADVDQHRNASPLQAIDDLVLGRCGVSDRKELHAASMRRMGPRS